MTPAALRTLAVQARTHLDAPDLARLMEHAAAAWEEAEAELASLRPYAALAQAEYLMRDTAGAALLAVLVELRESAEYWSEYDVPCGIVERMDAAISAVGR